MDSFHGPLKPDEIQRIEEVNLTIFQKHHLRLMAHCLASFKLMKHESSVGSFPNEADLLQWCMAQLNYQTQSEGKDFIPVLMEQFLVAQDYLEQLAAKYKISPMEITLDHLIACSLDHDQ